MAFPVTAAGGSVTNGSLGLTFVHVIDIVLKYFLYFIIINAYTAIDYPAVY